jgi:hypothetical protein
MELGMTDPNAIDYEVEDRKNNLACLIFDEITDRLHHNADLAGDLKDSRMPTPNMVAFEFADGRTIVVTVGISSKS